MIRKGLPENWGASGASACDVTDKQTDEAHADVFFVKARFGARFVGSAAAFAGGVVDAVGVDAAPETAFKLVLRSDTALGFDVTLSRVLAGNLTVPSLGIGDSDDGGSAELRRTRLRMA